MYMDKGEKGVLAEDLVPESAEEAGATAICSMCAQLLLDDDDNYRLCLQCQKVYCLRCYTQDPNCTQCKAPLTAGAVRVNQEIDSSDDEN